MKKTLLFLFLFYSFHISFGQIQRNIEIYPFADTIPPQFKEVFKFWKSYMDELNVVNLKNGALLDDMPEQLKVYWSEKDNSMFDFPDLYYAYFRSKGNVWYTNDTEYFLGITNRGDDLYQIKTMFKTSEESPFRGFPSAFLTIYVRKAENGLQLENAFNHHSSIVKTELPNSITYYYPMEYKLNDSLTALLGLKIEQFKKGFNLQCSKPINYVLSHRMTDISQLFGVDYNYFDYGSVLNTIQGGYTLLNNMVYIGGGGENYFHEIIHVLLSNYERGKYALFEEGVATYFGEHVGYTYKEHMPRFKIFLDQNVWIDLSQSFFGHSKVSINNLEDEMLKKENEEILQFRDLESSYNFQYMIHAVLCEIAFKDGGYEKVKELFLCKADNEDQFYNCIEEVLKIKRADINTYLRNFINTNY